MSRSSRRIVVMAVAAVLVGTAAGLVAGLQLGAAVGVALGIGAGWAAASAGFVARTWLVLGDLDSAETRTHATVEDPGRRTSDLLCLTACAVAVLAVLTLVLLTPDRRQVASVVVALIALVAVAASWALIHVIYMLLYARLYYSEPVGGIDFNDDEDPAYVDFAYVAFDLGMTYQISDTTLRSRTMRRAVLQHSLLSYVFGVVVLASAVNLVVSL